jgi:transcriptional regulator with XRE-family HTH domain
MTITSEQVTAARKLLGWNQEALGFRARVSQGTIASLETGRHRPIDQTMFAIRHAFEGAGIEFSEKSAWFRNEKAGP